MWPSGTRLWAMVYVSSNLCLLNKPHMTTPCYLGLLQVPRTSQDASEGNYSSAVTWVLGTCGTSHTQIALNLNTGWSWFLIPLGHSLLTSKFVSMDFMVLHALAPQYFSGLSSAILCHYPHFCHTSLVTVPGSHLRVFALAIHCT